MSRPYFMAAWAAAQAIYAQDNPSAKVASVIGGKVAVNINNPNPAQQWSNTCAVRMSYILNHCGLQIAYSAGQTVSGADGLWYFYRVNNLIDFLRRQWGKPETLGHPPASAGAFAGRQGLMLFEVSGWADAQGHATLFNGSACYDRCYFNKPKAGYQTQRVHFWSLP